MTDLAIQPPMVEPVEAIDPLGEVAHIPEKFATKVSVENVSAKSSSVNNDPKHANTALTGSMFPWAQQAKLLEMAETNTRFIWRFVESFARARSPDDLLALTAAFCEEGTLLFQEQSSTVLNILLVSPSSSHPT